VRWLLVAEFLNDGRVKTNVMLGLWAQYEKGSNQWAECLAMHVQTSLEKLKREGDPDWLLRALGEAFHADPPPWQLWPAEAKGNPETWIRLVSGQSWIDVEHQIVTRAGRELWEPFAQALQQWEAKHRTHGGDRSNPSDTGVDRDDESARGIRRRLQKRANAGDEQAKELVSQLATGDTTVNQAAIAAGMRKRYLRIPDVAPKEAAASLLARKGEEWATSFLLELADLLKYHP
jgi:hypothetical protein